MDSTLFLASALPRKAGGDSFAFGTPVFSSALSTNAVGWNASATAGAGSGKRAAIDSFR